MDISNLQPGRELDALVAERVMGWLNIHRDAYTPYGRDVCGTDPSGEGGWDKNGRMAVRHYSTDIAAALTVDRSEWRWRFSERLMHLEVTVSDTDGGFSVDVRWSEFTRDGRIDKAAAYAFGRCKAALMAATRQPYSIHYMPSLPPWPVLDIPR